MWQYFIKLVQLKISLQLYIIKKHQFKPKDNQILLILDFLDKLNQINLMLG